jgi:hypothetical protein
MTTSTRRRLALFGAPVALGTLAAFHPRAPEANLAVWDTVHVLQVPLVAWLGAGVILVLDGVPGRAATLARVAVLPWVAFFAAFDAIAGLAAGLLAGYGIEHPSVASVIGDATLAVNWSPLAAAQPVLAMAGSVVVLACAAVGLARSGASRTGAAALAAGGITWTVIHPVIDAPAMLVFILAAAHLEAERGRVPTVTAPPAGAAARHI